jgi:hypothetical protein
MSDLDVTGEFRALDLGAGEAVLKVENLFGGRVVIGGGGAVALFTVGNRSPSQVEHVIDADAFRFRARQSTATSGPMDSQAVLVLAATDWDGAQSRDLNAAIAVRADGQGSAFWTVESPGNEFLHMYPEGRLEVRRADGTASSYAADHLQLAASELPTASAAHEGEIRYHAGRFYGCGKTTTYAWKALA